MSNRAAFYNPDEVMIYFLGGLVSGFAEDSMVEVTQMAPGFDDVCGIDGEVARSRTNDRRVKVVVSLLQTSLSNALFSAAHKSDLNSPNGLGVGTFEMNDLSSQGTVVSGAQAWIVQYPDSTMERKAGARKWEIRIANGDRTEAGN